MFYSWKTNCIVVNNLLAIRTRRYIWTVATKKRRLDSFSPYMSAVVHFRPDMPRVEDRQSGQVLTGRMDQLSTCNIRLG